MCLIAKDHGFFLAKWHGTVVGVYRGPATTQTATAVSALCVSLLEDAPGPVTCLMVVERSSPAPDDPVRRVLANWSRDVVPRLAAAVVVSEGGGFRSALVRGVGVALTALLPHRLPLKFAGSVEEATRSIERFLPDTSGGAPRLNAEIAQGRALWLT